MVKAESGKVIAACAAWSALEGAVGPVSSLSTAENAKRMMALLDAVLDLYRSDAAPPGASGLLSFLTEWVTSYERAHAPIEGVSPAELLRHLMDSNGLKQRDLADELGGQPCVSAILSGKRLINARQARALGQRFAVSPAAFIAEAIATESAALPPGTPTAGPTYRPAVRPLLVRAGLTTEKGNVILIWH